LSARISDASSETRWALYDEARAEKQMRLAVKHEWAVNSAERDGFSRVAGKMEGEDRLGVIRAKERRKKGKTIIAEKEKRRRRGRRVREKDGKS